MGCVSSAVVNSVTICMLGCSGTGKTSIIEALLCEYSSEAPPIETGGIVEREIEINKRSYIFLDVPGFLSHKDEWEVVISKSDAAIIMFDPTTLIHAGGHVRVQFEEYAAMIAKRKIPSLALINKLTEPSEEIEQKVKTMMSQLENSKVSYLFHMTRKDILAEFSWLESFFV